MVKAHDQKGRGGPAQERTIGALMRLKIEMVVLDRVLRHG